MCTDVYRCVQEKNGAAIKEFFDVYKMCTDVYKMCTRCVQVYGVCTSLVHLSADPNFCNGYIRKRLHFPKRLYFPNGYICPTATFVTATFASASGKRWRQRLPPMLAGSGSGGGGF